MSFLSTRVVADSLARAFAALVNPAAKPGVRFLEIPGRTTATSIPTRHGDTSATIYHPAEQTGRRAGSIVVWLVGALLALGLL